MKLLGHEIIKGTFIKFRIIKHVIEEFIGNEMYIKSKSGNSINIDNLKLSLKNNSYDFYYFVLKKKILCCLKTWLKK